MRLIQLSLATLALLAATCISAADYYIDITNKTGYSIIYAYISPTTSEDWEEDVLGNDILRNGKTQRVDISGYDSPIFDIRLEDEDGDSYTFWKVNVAKQDLVVTLDDLD